MLVREKEHGDDVLVVWPGRGELNNASHHEVTLIVTLGGCWPTAYGLSTHWMLAGRWPVRRNS
jgi:hypothetical protein